MKIEKIEEVLQRLPELYSRELQKIWEKEQNSVLKQKEQNEENLGSSNSLIEIKYEHLPLINERIFGQFEPFVFKNMFHPENPSSFKFSVVQFKEVFFEKQERLLPYINAIYKITILVISRIGKSINGGMTVPITIQIL